MNIYKCMAGCLLLSLLLPGCTGDDPTDIVEPAAVDDPSASSTDPTNGDPLPIVDEDLKPLDPIEPLPPIEPDPSKGTDDPPPVAELPKQVAPPYVWKFNSAATAIAVSKDSKWIAIATGSNIQVIDSSSKEIAQTISGYDGSATSLSFVGNTSQLAGSVGTITSPGVIKVWDLANGAKEVKEFAGHFGLISMITCAADGKHIFSAGGDGIIYVWDYETAKVMKKLPAGKEAVQGVALRSDGKYLADASFSNVAHIWNLSQFNLVHTLDHPNHVLTVAYSPDGSVLATGCYDKLTRLFTAETGIETAQLKGHAGPVTTIAYSPDGKQIATGSGDGRVILWDTTTNKKLTEYQDHKGYVTSLVYLPDGSGLVSSGEDKSSVFYSIVK
jgi:WD40 repeat protein